jgi:hypothetical protein
VSGWESLPFVSCDGQNWPLGFAAKILEIPERELRKRVKQEQVEPAGVIRMADFRRSGRQPAAYPASELIRIAENIRTAQDNEGEEKVSRSA